MIYFKVERKYHPTIKLKINFRHQWNIPHLIIRAEKTKEATKRGAKQKNGKKQEERRIHQNENGPLEFLMKCVNFNPFSRRNLIKSRTRMQIFAQRDTQRFKTSSLPILHSTLCLLLPLRENVPVDVSARHAFAVVARSIDR